MKSKDKDTASICQKTQIGGNGSTNLNQDAHIVALENAIASGELPEFSRAINSLIRDVRLLKTRAETAETKLSKAETKITRLIQQQQGCDT